MRRHASVLGKMTGFNFSWIGQAYLDLDYLPCACPPTPRTRHATSRIPQRMVTRMVDPRGGAWIMPRYQCRGCWAVFIPRAALVRREWPPGFVQVKAVHTRISGQVAGHVAVLHE